MFYTFKDLKPVLKCTGSLCIINDLLFLKHGKLHMKLLAHNNYYNAMLFSVWCSLNEM